MWSPLLSLCIMLPCCVIDKSGPESRRCKELPPFYSCDIFLHQNGFNAVQFSFICAASVTIKIVSRYFTNTQGLNTPPAPTHTQRNEQQGGVSTHFFFIMLFRFFTFIIMIIIMGSKSNNGTGNTDRNINVFWYYWHIPHSSEMISDSAEDGKVKFRAHIKFQIHASVNLFFWRLIFHSSTIFSGL